MTRKYSLVIEGDPTGYSAYVPELPTILVTGRSVEELTDRATEAIRLYWESVRTDRSWPRSFVTTATGVISGSDYLKKRRSRLSKCLS